MPKRESKIVAARKSSSGGDDDDDDSDFDDFVESSPTAQTESSNGNDDVDNGGDDSNSDFEESKEEKRPKQKAVRAKAKAKSKSKVRSKPKTKKAKPVTEFSDPTPHLPVPHRAYDPIVKLTFGNCIYILKRIRADKLAEGSFKLLAGDRKIHYLGSTILFNHRIRQHLGHIGGGADITTNNLDDGKYVWFPICILHDTPNSSESKVPDMLKTESKLEILDEDEDDEDDDDPLGELKESEIRQIEYKIKHSNLSLGEGTNARFAMHKADGTLVYEKVRKMIILVNLIKWTKKCTRQAVGVPLTISWFMPDEMPSSEYSYLPPYVKEEIIDNYILPTPPKVIRVRKPKARKRRKRTNNASITNDASDAKRERKKRKTK